MTAKPVSETIGDPLATMARQGQVENIFATPIFWHVLQGVEALNAELRDLVLERERVTPSKTKSNQGGWQSSPDFFSWSHPAVATLARYASAAVSIATARIGVPPPGRADVQLYGWAAVNRKGHYNTGHVHPMATWSGVYYVDPGETTAEESSGALEFSHPVMAALMSFFPGQLPSARLVRPEAGMIILFPSYLQHSVRMYHGERPRICVPFNAHLRSMGA